MHGSRYQSYNLTTERPSANQSNQKPSDKDTHFGFTTVKESEKEGKGLYYRSCNFSCAYAITRCPASIRLSVRKQVNFCGT